MIQKKIGNNYEQKALQLLQNMGYWCHLFSYDKNGQPCDIIAFDNEKTYLIDVKHCNGDRFYVSRIEPNQNMCFKYANKCSEGNVKTGFVIWFDTIDKFKWLEWSEDLKTKTSFHYRDLEDF